MNVLGKDFQTLHNHCRFEPFTWEQMDWDLFAWISSYFLVCYSLLKRYFQKGHEFKSAWWSSLQLEHLNECGQGSPFLVSSLGGLVFGLALQHHPNSLWCLDLWGPLHFMYLAPWIRHEKVEWPHLQQFLHWGTPGFIVAPLTMAI